MSLENSESQFMDFEKACLEALKDKEYTLDLKMAVMHTEITKEGFEAIGGTKDIYYDIKEVVDKVAIKILSERNKS